ncbi:MAG TPA: 5-oxoprolinase subunit PxpA [Acidimicrobiales bacterium]|nr:5-oxoprolinase subunit PxpA [Acidimicrobiales bacterium]
MSPARSIDLNADLGEATDADGIATERALLDLVTTAHIACGGHAGDEPSMTATVAAALERDVRVGAHPSYPDTAGFGRRPMDIDRSELGRSLCDQLRALARVCDAAGTTIESVKPHGALYEEAAKGGAIYECLRDAVRNACPDDTALVLRSDCRAMAMALRDGIPACEEGFCDRAYRPDGCLVDRATPGAVLEDPDEAAAQALSLARGAVVTADGSLLTLWVDTLCVHGDTPGALALAGAVRRTMEEAGFEVTAPARA